MPRTNKKRIRITGAPEASHGSLPVILEKLCHMRTARNIGDEETVNHTMLGWLRQYGVKFEIID